MAQSVCVIGAGLSGLTATKSMIDAGLKVTCFEKDLHLGGRWNSRSQISIARSTITNTSRVDTAFSDFPCPSHMAVYITADEFSEYLELYAEKFKLREHICFGCNVVRASPLAQDISVDELNSLDVGWSVVVRAPDGVEAEYIFDFLVVATGFYTKSYVPPKTLQALDGFTGTIMHSIDYKDASIFDGKTVVVVGMGNSGGDIVCEASVRSGRKAYLCTDRGAQVFPRILPGGQPLLDMLANRLINWLPDWVIMYTMKQRQNSLYDHDKLCLAPTCFAASVNDEIMAKIACGRVVVKPSLLKSVEKTLYFSNGSCIKNVDVVVLCTGYTRELPFLSDGIVPMQENGKRIPLYKGIFAPNLRRRLAFIGFFSVMGSASQTSEMQARFAAAVFAGAVKLPSATEMRREIEDHAKNLLMNFRGAVKEYNVILRFWPYVDGLARGIGCAPSWWKILTTDPLLFWKMLRRYSIFDYRLYGPNSWSGARDCLIRRDADLYIFTKEYR